MNAHASRASCHIIPSRCAGVVVFGQLSNMDCAVLISHVINLPIAALVTYPAAKCVKFGGAGAIFSGELYHGSYSSATTPEVTKMLNRAKGRSTFQPSTIS
jgi:hypothetical protein